MSRLTTAKKQLASAVSSAFLGMALAALAIHLTDRFTGNESVRSFYMTERGVTCFVIKTRGEQLLSCLPGEYPEEEKP